MRPSRHFIRMNTKRINGKIKIFFVFVFEDKKYYTSQNNKYLYAETDGGRVHRLKGTVENISDFIVLVYNYIKTEKDAEDAKRRAFLEY